VDIFSTNERPRTAPPTNWEEEHAMTSRKAVSLLAGAALAVLSLSSAAIAQQSLVRPGVTGVPTAADQKNYKVPHNVFGQPDLEGVWTNATVTPLERDNAKFGDRLVMTPQELAARENEEKAYIAEGDKPTDPNLKVTDLPVNCGRGFSGTNCGYNRGWTDPGETVMRVKGEPRTSFITSTPNGRMPAVKAGVRPPQRGGGGAGFNVNDNPETKTLAERCLTSFGNSAGPVMLPLLYNNNYQIAQNRDTVAIWVEMVHDVRQIDLRRTAHLPSNIRPWFGDSIGHYEGDTLVVETTNYPRQNAFRGAWEDLKVTERFTRVAKDRVLYQFKVEAPSVWDTAWGGEYEFGTSKGLVYEYACAEGNYALEDMLAGARAEDAVAQKTASK
jgi:hypothetical protein